MLIVVSNTSTSALPAVADECHGLLADAVYHCRIDAVLAITGPKPVLRERLNGERMYQLLDSYLQVSLKLLCELEVS